MEDDINVSLAETNENMLTRLAYEINAIKEQTRKTVYVAMMDIGQRLLQAKGAVGHGNWEKWLKENVDYSLRTAQRLIASYERFGDGQQKLFGRSADPEQLAELNKTQIMTLMSIKDEEKCFEYLAEHKDEVKDMTKAELEALAKKLNNANKELESTKKRLESAASELDIEKKMRRTAQDGANKYKADLDVLTARLEDIEKMSGNNESVQELAELKDKYADLQDELRRAEREKEEVKAARPQTVETVVEKIPEETLQQMEQLRTRIRELEAAGQDIKTPEEKSFGHHMMNVKTELEAAVTQLMAINDGEKKLRYAALLRRLMQGVLDMKSWAEG